MLYRALRLAHTVPADNRFFNSQPSLLPNLPLPPLPLLSDPNLSASIQAKLPTLTPFHDMKITTDFSHKIISASVPETVAYGTIVCVQCLSWRHSLPLLPQRSVSRVCVLWRRRR